MRTLTSEQKLGRFLTDLALKRDVAASTQNQAFNAIAFFYKVVLGTPLHEVDALHATRPVHLRHAPTVSETRALWQAVCDPAGYPTQPNWQERWTETDLRALTPLIWEHVNPYGRFELNITTRLPLK